MPAAARGSAGGGGLGPMGVGRMVEPTPTEGADQPKRDKRPEILVIVDIPHAGGAGLRLGLPGHVTERRAQREGPPLPAVFTGGGGIDPEDMEELRVAVQAEALRVKGVRMFRGAFPFTLADMLPHMPGGPGSGS